MTLSPTVNVTSPPVWSALWKAENVPAVQSVFRFHDASDTEKWPKIRLFWPFRPFGGPGTRLDGGRAGRAKLLMRLLFHAVLTRTGEPTSGPAWPPGGRARDRPEWPLPRAGRRPGPKSVDRPQPSGREGSREFYRRQMPPR